MLPIIMQKLLENVYLQIGTPALDYKVDVDYVACLHSTMEQVRHFGGKVDWLRLPGNSDLPCARAKIFGHFYRSEATHLLMVDADMTWGATDVIRMLDLKRDFIAGVGMKKKFPQEFALNCADDKGNPHPIEYEADTGIMNITEVGMAFTLISRVCAEKMVNHYPELEFDLNGQIEHDVFAPMIVPKTKRRLGEDYAFCYRWKRIGGKVQILPTVKLGHIGRHVWEGAFSDLAYG